METQSRSEGEGSGAEAGDSTASIAAYETRPGRTVFVALDNCDGWIASDLAVEPRP